MLGYGSHLMSILHNTCEINYQIVLKYSPPFYFIKGINLNLNYL